MSRWVMTCPRCGTYMTKDVPTKTVVCAGRYYGNMCNWIWFGLRMRIKGKVQARLGKIDLVEYDLYHLKMIDNLIVELEVTN